MAVIFPARERLCSFPLLVGTRSINDVRTSLSSSKTPVSSISASRTKAGSRMCWNHVTVMMWTHLISHPLLRLSSFSLISSPDGSSKVKGPVCLQDSYPRFIILSTQLSLPLIAFFSFNSESLVPGTWLDFFVAPQSRSKVSYDGTKNG